jgi:U3 small nucleolar RNA-associated protein 20
MREQLCGSISEGFAKHLFNLIVCIGSLAEKSITTLARDNLISFKNLRASCLQQVIKIFENIDTYPWQEDEIDVIFDLFIWPYLEKLPTDSIHSPTPLLKLFLEWSRNSRYHVLLAKHCERDCTLTPLPYIVKLMTGENTNDKVVRAIMEFVEKLLLLEVEAQGPVEGVMEVDGTSGAAIHVQHVVAVDETKLKLLKLDEAATNYGTKLLLPYISDILSILKETLKRKNKAPTKRNLFILARVTELVTDSDTCNKLVSIMLPIILKRTQLSIDSQDLQNMLTTLSNVIKMVDKPEAYVRRMAPLFDQITDIGARKLLCNILADICDRTDNAMLKDLVIELNAWNKRWLEQPDYDRRLQAFREIDRLLSNDALTMEIGVITIYHCYYFLKHDDDLAIRDNSSTHLRSLAVYLVKKYQNDAHDKIYILDNVIFSYVNRAIKGSNAKFREESCLLLGELARECPDAHPILTDLQPLTCKEDREIDFFDNIVHMQQHRHMRALNRFVKISQEYKQTPNVRTLMEVILPIAQHYICNETYLKKAKMVEASVEAIGSLCKFLPWAQYEYLLKLYLFKLRKSLEYQKQLVKLVIIILDGYHFDLSLAESKSKALTEGDATVDDEKDVIKTVDPDVEQEGEEGDEEEAPPPELVSPNEGSSAPICQALNVVFLNYFPFRRT